MPESKHGEDLTQLVHAMVKAAWRLLETKFKETTMEGCSRWWQWSESSDGMTSWMRARSACCRWPVISELVSRCHVCICVPGIRWLQG